jgi:hypothetical protein
MAATPAKKPKRFFRKKTASKSSAPGKKVVKQASLGKAPIRATKLLAPKELITPEFFNAIEKRPCINTLPSMGEFTPVYLQFRKTQNTNADASLLVVMYQSTNGTAALQIHTDDHGNKTKGEYELYPYTELDGGNAPIATRPSRTTVKVSVPSRADSINGIVNCIMISDPLVLQSASASHFTTASVDGLVNLVRNSPSSKQIPLSAFTQNVSFSLGFASVIKGAEWEPFTAPRTAATVAADLARGACSVFIMEIPKLATDQMQFSMTFYQQLPSKYGAGHIMASGSTKYSRTLSGSSAAANRAQSTTVLAHR